MAWQTRSHFWGLMGRERLKPPPDPREALAASAQAGACQTLMMRGMFLRERTPAISIASRVIGSRWPAAAAGAGSLVSTGHQWSKGMATRAHATRRFSRL